MPQRPPAVETRYPLRSRLNRFLCLDSSAGERRTHIPEVDGSNPSRGTREREKVICQYHVLRHAKVKPYCNIYLVRHSHQIQTRTANFRIFFAPLKKSKCLVLPIYHVQKRFQETQGRPYASFALLCIRTQVV